MIWAGPFFSLLVAQASATAVAEVPFWKAKEKVYQRIQEERAVIFSVRTEKMANDKQTLLWNGGGQTSAPLDFTYKTAINIEHVKKGIDYIEEIRWEGPPFAPTSRLYVKAKAYGLEADMRFIMRTTPSSALHFEIVEGTLKGAEGDFTLVEVVNPDLHKRTEVGMTGHFDYVKFPLPKIFLEFGIEIILQRMAVQMRSYVEELYKKGT